MRPSVAAGMKWLQTQATCWSAILLCRKAAGSRAPVAFFSSTVGRKAELKRSESFQFDVPKTTFSTENNKAVPTPKTVVIAGAAGNLGSKAAQHLLNSTTRKYKLILMDAADCPEQFKQSPENGHSIRYITCDLSKYDSNWAEQIAPGSTVFLFAAKHPQPDASSSDMFTSMLINANMLEACARAKVDRIVLASSNHVVGGMLHQKGKIAANARPMIGTKYRLSGITMDSTLYATAKVAAEVQTKAMVESGRIDNAIIVRIGFCQPGENKKATLPIEGNPSKRRNHNESMAIDKEHEKEIMNWWKGMYLSNEDFGKLVDSCIEVKSGQKAEDKQASGVKYVNGVSANPESRWEVEPNDVGFRPAAASM